MAKVDFQPKRPHELLAVFPDEQTAKQVVLDLRQRMSGTEVRKGAHQDEQQSLNAEMAEEVEQSWLSPQAGFLYPKESAKTATAMFPLAVLGSLVVCVPIALAWPGVTLGARIVMGIGIALGMAGTITLILMALGQKGPSEPMAAEQGVTVRVKDDNEAVRKLLLDAHPIRLDVVDDRGRPIETIATEGDSSSAKEIGERFNEWP